MPETVVHFQVRMPPALHEQLSSWAMEDKLSLNALVVDLLRRAAEEHGPAGMQGDGAKKPVRAGSA